MKIVMPMCKMSLAVVASALLALPVLAQPGPGWGGGPGAQGEMPCAANCGPGAGSGTGPGPGAGPGYGRGMGHGMGHGGRHGMRFNQRNTQGWTLMSPDERVAHRDKMFAAKTYDECQLVQSEHRTQMETRAKEKGIALPAPQFNGCDRMKARGILK